VRIGNELARSISQHWDEAGRRRTRSIDGRIVIASSSIRRAGVEPD